MSVMISSVDRSSTHEPARDFSAAHRAAADFAPADSGRATREDSSRTSNGRPLCARDCRMKIVIAPDRLMPRLPKSLSASRLVSSSILKFTCAMVFLLRLNKGTLALMLYIAK